MKPAAKINSTMALKAGLLASATIALQGCVAAVMPLAAGGLLGGVAPGYEPNGVERAAPAFEGTVEVERSQAQVPGRSPPPTPAEPEPELANAAIDASTSAPIQGVPGLATEALEDAANPVRQEPAEEAHSFVETSQVNTPTSNTGPAATSAIEQVPEVPANVRAAGPSGAPSNAVEPAAEFAAANANPEFRAAEPGLATGVENQINPAAAIAAETPGDPFANPALVTELASGAEPVASELGDDSFESAIAEQSRADPVTAVSAPVRVIAVGPEADFADGSNGASGLSAADAAAALARLPSEQEPTVDSATLARSPTVEEAVSQVERTSPELANDTPVRMAAALAPAADTSVAGIEPVIEPGSEDLEARPGVVNSAMPSPTASPEGPTVRTMATGPFASLINYANTQQMRSNEERSSALLADRASLRPERATCGGNEPVVLIDLDPEGGMFDPTNASLAAPGLANALAQMRASGVKVSWISSNSVSQIRGIRAALNRSGLDIADSDEVLLMRYPEDRKQTRREDLAENACLIAIAGDVRTDFDELFEYLINPEAASTLDPLFENGWFLIPSPFRSTTGEAASEPQESPTR